MPAAVAALALALLCVGARADESAPVAAPPNDGIVKTIAKKLGMATDVGPPADFVVKSRPKVPEDYIPVGRKPFTRDVEVKTPEQLKAIEDDLDAVQARHDALLASFPPSAKAVAQAQAAKAAKGEKPKKPPPAAAAQ